jgi:hypothetical protein
MDGALKQVEAVCLPSRRNKVANLNPDLCFFAYFAVVLALCPICERVANMHSKE